MKTQTCFLFLWAAILGGSGLLAQSASWKMDGDGNFITPDSIRNTTLLKVAYVQTTTGFPNVSVGIEHSKNDWSSLYGRIGSGPPNCGRYCGDFRYIFLHAELEMRFYYALRFKRPLTGFYVGPTAGFDGRRFWYTRSDDKGYELWPQFGVSLGYQHTFRGGWRIGTGIKFGYPLHQHLWLKEEDAVWEKVPQYGPYFWALWGLEIGYQLGRKANNGG